METVGKIKVIVIESGNVEGEIELDTGNLLLCCMSTMEPVDKEEAENIIEVLNAWLGRPSRAVVTEKELEP